jgi:hypothetical protein
MSSERYFTSQEPLSGEPSLLWHHFRRPRLRRFPDSADNLKLGRYLGGGIDGFVFKARVRGQTESLAVKIVSECLYYPGTPSSRPDLTSVLVPLRLPPASHLRRREVLAV